MGLLKRLVNVLGTTLSNDDTVPAVSGPLAVLNRDSRLHPRYNILDPGTVVIRFPDGTVGDVKNISYGGLAALLPRAVADDEKRFPRDSTAMLEVVGDKRPCGISAVRMVPQGPAEVLVGFSLRHDTPATLLFLREFIEPLRCGETLTIITDEMRRDRYRGKDWTCMRGDGPTDLILRFPSDDRFRRAPIEGLVTFRFNETYCELALSEGRFSTGVAQSPDRSGGHRLGARMRTTATLDHAIVRQAVAIMMGASPSCRPQLAGFLALALEAVGVKL